MKTNKQFLKTVAFGLATFILASGCAKKVSSNETKEVAPTDASEIHIDTPNTPSDMIVKKTPAVMQKEAMREAFLKTEADAIVASMNRKMTKDPTSQPVTPKNEKVEEKLEESSEAVVSINKPDSEKSELAKIIEERTKVEAEILACKKRLNAPELIAKRKAEYLRKDALEKEKERNIEKEIFIAKQKKYEQQRIENRNKKSLGYSKSITLARDTEEIKKNGIVQVTFKDLPGLLSLSDTDFVLLNSKVKSMSEAMTILQDGDEGHFCRVEGAFAFHSGDALKYVNGDSRYLLNKEKDIYESRAEFQNSNGTLSFVCTHASPGFFLQDFVLNFSPYLEVKSNGTLLSGKDYSNLYADERRLNAIRILDLKRIKEITLAEGKESFSMSDGQVYSTDQLANEVAGGNRKMSCSVVDVQGEMDTQKTYIKVDGGAEKTSTNIPTANSYTVYRADAKNAFTLNCFVQISTPVTELFSAAKGILEFGVLGRIDYMKKRSEMIDLNKTLKPKNEKTLSEDYLFEATDEDCRPASSK